MSTPWFQALLTTQLWRTAVNDFGMREELDRCPGRSEGSGAGSTVRPFQSWPVRGCTGAMPSTFPCDVWVFCG